jgi:hypothetical protein
MTLYRVKWEIDIQADSAEEAAREALAIHRDPESIATQFDVAANVNGRLGDWQSVDLFEDAEGP